MTARLVVLLPAYNEAANLGALLRAIEAVRIDGVALTPLVVDDGSRDGTADVARAGGAVTLSHPINRGVGAAFRTGLAWALDEGIDYLVHMDADGQLLPSEIPLLYAPVGRGEADLAIGSRFVERPPPGMKLWHAQALRSVAGAIGVLTGYELTDISCGFRCMNRRVMSVLRPTFDYDYIQEALIQALAAHARVVDVPVTVRYGAVPGPGDAGAAAHVRKGMSAQTFRYGRRFLALSTYAMVRFYAQRAFERVGALERTHR